MWLSRKNLGQLAALYDLVTRAKNKTAATCKAQKMVLGYRGRDVANRENTHSNLKGSHKWQNARLAQQRRYSECFQSKKGMGGCGMLRCMAVLYGIEELSVGPELNDVGQFEERRSPLPSRAISTSPSHR